MWIRSQDKKSLVNTEHVSEIGYYKHKRRELYEVYATYGDAAVTLGFYPTPDKTVSVLDEIEKHAAYTKLNLFKMPPADKVLLRGGDTVESKRSQSEKEKLSEIVPEA